jgi:hypothetical protein
MWHSDNDAIEVVNKLNADDGYARKLAEASGDFARKYLVKEVMMVSGCMGRGGASLTRAKHKADCGDDGEGLHGQRRWVFKRAECRDERAGFV